MILGSEMSPTGTSYRVSFRLTPHSRSPMPGIPVGMGARGSFASPVWPLWVGLPLENIFLFFSCLGSLLIEKKKKQKGNQRPSLGFPDSDRHEAGLEGRLNWLLSEPPGPAGPSGDGRRSQRRPAGALSPSSDQSRSKVKQPPAHTPPLCSPSFAHQKTHQSPGRWSGGRLPTTEEDGSTSPPPSPQSLVPRHYVAPQ